MGRPIGRTINPSAISYKPKINSRTVQGERNGAGAQVVTEKQEGLLVPAKGYPWGRFYDGSYRGYPKRGLLPVLFRGEEVRSNLR